jgi:hypothetical protein
MRVLVATDAWHPQVNGVVRTLTSLARSALDLGVTIDFLTPDGFPSIPVPTYPGLRLALPGANGIAQRIAQATPDAIHIATEGPIGHMVRRYCVNRGLPFTTSYTTRFPEYISARLSIPEAWSYGVLRRFHAAATVTMVSTPSLMAEFTERGFKNLGMWTRGVDTELFSPAHAIALDYPRPIFVSVGRVAVEKNLEAFLSLDLLHQAGHRARAAAGRAAAPVPEREVSRPAGGLGFGGASGGRRRVRVSQPHRHLRGRAARGARLRHSDRGLSGDGSARRHRRQSHRGRRRGLAGRVPGGPADVAHGLPRLRPDPLLGKQRTAVHRAHEPGGHGQRPKAARSIEGTDCSNGGGTQQSSGRAGLWALGPVL